MAAKNSEMVDNLLKTLTTSPDSYYEYYSKDETVKFNSQNNTTDLEKVSKAIHLHLDSVSDKSADYMIMVYTILEHGGVHKEWKIASEGPNSPNPSKALVFDQMSKDIADRNNWKYIALGIAATPQPTDSYYNILNDYVVAIESYDCGQKTVIRLEPFMDKLVLAGTPSFMRFSNEGLSMAFVKKTNLANYLEMFDNRPFQKYVSNAVKYIPVNSTVATDEKIQSYPFNWLISGAPGTGKSFFLNTECEKLIFGGKTLEDVVKEAVDNDTSTETDEIKTTTYKKMFEQKKKEYISRVTFYEDYIYDSFVGGYRPVVLTDDTAEFSFDGKDGEKTESKVSYEFVPGPFIDMYIKAKNDKDHNYCLIIEELNRAKAASVFGDMFQLLDREDGISVYHVTPSKELRNYLENHLNDATDADEIRLPNNFYIWATMNSADRGVFPIDSAFKRRWTFKCKNVYEPRSEADTITFFWDGKKVEVLFDGFRTIINEKIGEDEDKYIGPWYFSKSELKAIEEYHSNESKDIDCSVNPLVSKLLLYLRQDIFRQDPTALFYEGNTVSKILNSYGEKYGIDKILKIDSDEIESLQNEMKKENSETESSATANNATSQDNITNETVVVTEESTSQEETLENGDNPIEE